MLVQNTPINLLPADVRARLMERLASNFLGGSPSTYFEGYYIAEGEIQLLREAARAKKTTGDRRSLFE